MLIRFLLGIAVAWLVVLVTRTLSNRLLASTRRPPPRRVARPDRRQRALATLGLEDSASVQEIRRAYKRLAKKYHPDRVAHLGPELVKLTEEKFKEVKQAYDDLSGSGRT